MPLYFHFPSNLFIPGVVLENQQGNQRGKTVMGWGRAGRVLPSVMKSRSPRMIQILYGTGSSTALPNSVLA